MGDSNNSVAYLEGSVDVFVTNIPITSAESSLAKLYAILDQSELSAGYLFRLGLRFQEREQYGIALEPLRSSVELYASLGQPEQAGHESHVVQMVTGVE